MCGRYAMKADERELRRKYPFLDDEYFDIHGPKKRPEIFPGTPIFAINNQFKGEDVWWTIRDRGWDGKTIEAINAKAETVERLPLFRDAFKTYRVLIPATHLFEWQVQPDKSKVKYRIWFDEPIFAFAGIARDCEIKGETRRCGAIITTSPNEKFKLIHNTRQRQAVVIREADYEKWLDPKTKTPDLKNLMLPLPDEVTFFEVDTPEPKEAA